MVTATEAGIILKTREDALTPPNDALAPPNGARRRKPLRLVPVLQPDDGEDGEAEVELQARPFGRRNGDRRRAVCSTQAAHRAASR